MSEKFKERIYWTERTLVIVLAFLVLVCFAFGVGSAFAAQETEQKPPLTPAGEGGNREVVAEAG
jgi:hypothetical protein